MEALLDSLYGAAANPSAWPACSKDLASLLGATSSMLFIEDRKRQTMTPLAMPDYTGREQQMYAQHYHRIDPFVRATHLHTHLDAALGTSLVNQSEFARSEIWNKFIAKGARSFHFLCAMREMRPGVVFGVAVHRTPQMHGFGGPEQLVLQRIVPHLHDRAHAGQIDSRQGRRRQFAGTGAARGKCAALNGRGVFRIAAPATRMRGSLRGFCNASGD